VEESELMTRARARIGTVLRRKYRIDRVLGVGGMAVVYAATHEVNHAEFAIKMLHPELSIRKDIATRFLREGLVGNTVKHKGAVKVLDNDVAEDGAAFLVMELLDGSGVEQIWEKHGHKLPTRVVLAITHQLLDVLAAAHGKQIVHRDIKPANLFLTREGVLKVLDFGIARLRDATAESATHTGMLLGTPAYMAPEQALAQSSLIDGLTDVWAVGATMFAMLSGQTVHVGENAQQLMVAAATKPSRSLAAVAPGVSPRVVAIVDRAVAFDKAQRWPGAAQMRDAVRDAFLAEFSINVSPGSLIELFENDAGRAATFYADAVASTPIADHHEGTSATVTSAGVLTAAPVASPGTGAVPMTMRAAEVVSAPKLLLVGGTTTQPISSDPQPSESVRLPKSSSAKMVGGIAAAVAVLAIGAGVVVMKQRETAATAAPATEAIVSAPPAAMPLPDPSTTPVATAAASVPAATGAIVTPATAPLGPRPAPGARPAVAPSASAAKSAAPALAPPSAAPAPPSPAAAPAPTPSCHAESYLDSDGQTRYRTVCK
jgi:serine/threonine-protein kinase